ncbi:hypothetical protein A2U01_0115629, partial [Trifolium medium]|nr:hypothetical protein [Trifolium medium]
MRAWLIFLVDPFGVISSIQSLPRFDTALVARAETVLEL